MKTIAPLLAIGLLACTGGVETSFKRLTPEIASAPGDVDFGGVVKLYPITKTVQLLNTGAGTLDVFGYCLLYTSPSPRDATLSRMPSSA